MFLLTFCSSATAASHCLRRTAYSPLANECLTFESKRERARESLNNCA
jgi:hypothetical protein